MYEDWLALEHEQFPSCSRGEELGSGQGQGGVCSTSCADCKVGTSRHSSPASSDRYIHETWLETGPGYQGCFSLAHASIHHLELDLSSYYTDLTFIEAGAFMSINNLRIVDVHQRLEPDLKIQNLVWLPLQNVRRLPRYSNPSV